VRRALRLLQTHRLLWAYPIFWLGIGTYLVLSVNRLIRVTELATLLDTFTNSDVEIQQHGFHPNFTNKFRLHYRD